MRSDRGKVLIQETLAIWEERYPNALSEDDAQQIITNTTALFNTLAEWDQQFRAEDNDEPTAEKITGGEHAAY